MKELAHHLAAGHRDLYGTLRERTWWDEEKIDGLRRTVDDCFNCHPRHRCRMYERFVEAARTVLSGFEDA